MQSLTLFHLSGHVANRLLREQRKTIPKFLSGKKKKTFKKCNPPDFEFYPNKDRKQWNRYQIKVFLKPNCLAQISYKSDNKQASYWKFRNVELATSKSVRLWRH